MGIKYTEKTEKIVVKITFVGGQIQSFIASWEIGQNVLQTYRKFLRWRYANDAGKLEIGPVFVNYFFQRLPVDKGELDAVIDFFQIFGISIDNIPDETKYDEEERVNRKIMVESQRILAESQAEMVKLMKKKSDEGEDWRKGPEWD